MWRHQKFAASANVFGKVAEEMIERAAVDSRKNAITHSQVRNEFKKLVCQFKSVSLSLRTAHKISYHHEEKGYGKWWDILFPFVGSGESAEPLNIVESWFESGSQNTDPKNDLEGSKNATADQKGECKPEKNKEAIEQFTNFNEILYW